jgi:hypothetical protein
MESATQAVCCNAAVDHSIGGLKKQGFLIAQGKHIVPRRRACRCSDVLKRADPALVDPGVTAQMECLLDDVVIGKREMIGAIDAVCDVAQRIIDELDGANLDHAMAAQRIKAGCLGIDDDLTHGCDTLSKIRIAASKAQCLLVSRPPDGAG